MVAIKMPLPAGGDFAGDLDRLRARTSGDLPLWDLFRRHGSFRVMYVIADVLGLAAIEPPRPLLPLPADFRSPVEQALQHLDRGTGAP